MAKNLVIVESPAKAKTIEGFLGKDFLVKSSFGHIRDLSHKKMGVDIENNFAPDYEISSDKKDLVKELKKDVKTAETVWLATDEDREGEAIAWHLYETLALKNKEVKRIVFHEITKTAITNAIENPRELDIHLVNAQQARRILDRLVGFELSPVLWKKVQRGLSAGRVQSVAVRLIAEQERAIQKFEYSSTYRIQANFKADKGDLKAEYTVKPDTKEAVGELMEKFRDANYSIQSVESKAAKRNPQAPFTTSTLQQEASRLLSFSVSKTMMVAQRLYEAGNITYMRTDSVNLSKDAMNASAAYISETYGDKYVHTRNYSTKSKGAQEAHEAIRPTYMAKDGSHLSGDEKRLYELIRKRTLASQMSAAEFLRSTVKIAVSTTTDNFVAKGEILTFDGFLKVYQSSENSKDVILPKIEEGEQIDREIITATERFSKHPPRYNEASLVRKLEELGIGRPSTYAPTISTIQRRNYVEKEDREGKQRDIVVLTLENNDITTEEVNENYGAERGKLFPTDIGLIVNDFLFEHFGKIMDYHFTANVEDLFDDVAQGKLNWQEMIGNFYGGFHANIEDVTENSERSVGLRELGVEPGTGEPIIVRIGRYGPMVQIGETSDDKEKKPRFASLKKGQSLETITLEEALELFKLPRQVGEFEGKVMTAAIGRFGPYIRHDGKFVSLKEDDPLDINADRAIELIKAKRQADLDKIINIFDQEEPLIEVLKGRWGPFIKSEKKNYKIPKDVDASTLDRAACIDIMNNQPTAKKKKTTRKKTTKK
jgi:DNA topoisomerase-1